MGKRKYYYQYELMEKFNNLSDKRKVPILLDALSRMSGCNSYSEERRICEAMGYCNENGGEDKYLKL